MAAVNAVDTQNEREQELDPIEWLKSNRCDVFIEYFKETGLTISELLTYDEKDIEGFIKDCKIEKFVFVKRFKHALRKLQRDKSVSKAAASNFGQVYRVVISNKESENIKKLESKLSELEVVLNDNLSKVSDLLENAQKKDADIEKVFAMLRNKLNEREKGLRNQFNGLSNEIINKLKEQQQKLESYKKSINNGLSEQQAMTLDPNIDSIKRENIIIQIANNTLNNINQQDLKLEVPPIQFIIDQDEVMKYISVLGSVMSNKSDAPKLVISAIDYQSAKVKVECKSEDEIIGYSLRYKVGGNDNDDDEKEEWIDVDIGKENKYTLNNLKRDTKYSILGRYRVNLSNRWSDQSKQSVFKTLEYDSRIHDVIERITEYPHCDYNIPYVFKIRQDNDVTLFLGCDRYEILDNQKIKIHLPYVYIKQTSEWFRVYGGSSSHQHGIMAGKRIAYIMKLEYVKICDDIQGVYGKRYDDDATNKLKQMYYVGSRQSVSSPTLTLSYKGKGSNTNDMPWILFKSTKQQIVIS